MAKGGKRLGAGRKKGSITRRSQEIVAKATAQGVSPLEFMLDVLRDPTKEFKDRFAAAIQAAPYVHPKLASTNVTGDIKVQNFSDEQLAAARAALLAAAAVIPS